MVAKIVSDDEFIEAFRTIGAREMSKLGMGDERGIYRRRDRLESARGMVIKAPNKHRAKRKNIDHPARVQFSVYNGTVIVGSDAHYWPNYVTTAHRAFVRACKTMNPVAVIMNGDALDGCTISRHAPIGWENRPALEAEVETCKERLDEIERAAPNARRVWPLGNHDARFETRLATVAPEYARIHGVHLKDHFPYWEGCWSCWINDDVVIKHKYKGGIHATHNNTMWAGKTIITGHLHSLKVTPLNDYNGIRWGVDTGTLADPNGPQFLDYTEDGPKNWRSGFVVLTFIEGRLMWPEIVHVIDEQAGKVEFRGSVYEV